MSDLQARNDPQSPGMTPEYEGDVKREDEELATLGGKTRLVPRKASSSSASSPTTASASPRSSPAISNILPALSYASQVSPPHQIHPLPLAAPPPPPQPSPHVGWQTYEYQQQQQQQQPSQPMAHPPHAHTHNQPQAPAPHNHNHVPLDHQGPMRGYNYTQYWQHQQATEYPYNGMHAGPSTTYMPASPGSMGFDYAASLRAESYLSAVHPSSMPPQQAARTMHVNSDYSPGTDPNMAWHDLVAQFNHV